MGHHRIVPVQIINADQRHRFPFGEGLIEIGQIKGAARSQNTPHFSKQRKLGRRRKRVQSHAANNFVKTGPIATDPLMFERKALNARDGFRILIERVDGGEPDAGTFCKKISR